ncbi:hypothetical protein AVEN_213281-1 [Araneus ventricosus]|uniref:Uncharacterized protein n=1 Tax=Araneus ventricosus TaxID=182803 RepID=A0A4Y2QHY1_ARAVE|nr:hypothetical protein AVEN_213281-1 [Araneus ventricosus]
MALAPLNLIQPTDLTVTSSPEVSNTQKNRARSKSEKSQKLKQAKRGLSQKDLPAKLKKSAHQNSVALGLADRGIVHKDLPSIFGGVPSPRSQTSFIRRGCGVVFPSDTLSYRLHNGCSVFTAELVAIFCALQEISPSSQRNFIIYTDSMSALETLSL